MVTGAKPAALITSVYVPGCTGPIAKFPSRPPVTALELPPGALSTICAEGMSAPDGSETVPRISPEGPWARAAICAPYVQRRRTKQVMCRMMCLNIGVFAPIGLIPRRSDSRRPQIALAVPSR